MYEEKLNVFTVSGLMTGPILGSGIIFLPFWLMKCWVSSNFCMDHHNGTYIFIAYVLCKMTIIASENRGIST